MINSCSWRKWTNLSPRSFLLPKIVICYDGETASSTNFDIEVSKNVHILWYLNRIQNVIKILKYSPIIFTTRWGRDVNLDYIGDKDLGMELNQNYSIWNGDVIFNRLSYAICYNICHSAKMFRSVIAGIVYLISINITDSRSRPAHLTYS